MPLILRLPKVGFHSKRPMIYQLVKLSGLSRFKEGTLIDANFLKTHGLIKSTYKPFKILADGEIKKPFTIQAHAFSQGAKEKITKAGGKVEIIGN
jgi:large subunit ribosomal protein L15